MAYELENTEPKLAMKITKTQMDALESTARLQRLGTILVKIEHWHRRGAKMAYAPPTGAETLLQHARQASMQHGLQENAIGHFLIILSRKGVDATTDRLITRLENELLAAQSIPTNLKLYAIYVLANHIEEQIEKELSAEAS